MTIFGLNSPELFALLVIILVILGSKRIEKGLDLFSRLLKFLLSNQNSFDKKNKKKVQIKEKEETQENKDEIKKSEEKTNIKENELIKEKEETQKKEDKSEKGLKITGLDNNVKKSVNIKDAKEIVKDKTVTKSKTKNPKNKVKDKNVMKSKTINIQEETLEK